MIESLEENEKKSLDENLTLKDDKQNIFNNTRLKLNYFCICLYAFITGTDFAVIIPTLWDRLSFDYSATGTFMGIVISAYSFSGVVSGLIMGKISDKKKNNKIFMLLSIIFAVAGHVLYFFGINKYFVLLARAISGISIGASTVVLAFIARTTTENKRTSVLSIVMASRQFGLMFGPAFNIVLRQASFYLFGKFLVDKKSIPGLFMAFLWSLFFFIFVFFFKETNFYKENNDQEPIEDTEKINSRKYLTKFCRIEILLLLAITFFTYFNQTSLETMVIPFTEIMFDWNELENSILFCCGGLVIIISFIIIRILSKKFKDRVILLFGLSTIIIGLSIACLFLPFVDKFDKVNFFKNQTAIEANSTAETLSNKQKLDGIFFAAFIIFVILDVIGLPAIAITSASLFTKMIDNKSQGFGQGIQRGILGIGTIIGPLCAGPLIYKPLIMVSIIFFIISLIFILFMIFFKRFKPIDEYSLKRNTVK